MQQTTASAAQTNRRTRTINQPSSPSLKLISTPPEEGVALCVELAALLGVQAGLAADFPSDSGAAVLIIVGSVKRRIGRARLMPICSGGTDCEFSCSWVLVRLCMIVSSGADFSGRVEDALSLAGSEAEDDEGGSGD